MTTTKAQERKALEQIRKIVEGLGDDSYIGMAFEGCFEMAEENIENDFGLSMKQEVESLVKQLAKQTEEKNNYKDAYEQLNKNYDSDISLVKENLRIAKENAENNRNWYDEQYKKAEALEAQVKEQAQQILELKAKLYDYMVKEAH